VTLATPALPGARRRRASSIAFRACSYLALLAVVGPALWLLIAVVARAVPHFQWNVLTNYSSHGEGGLENLVLGTLLLMAGVFFVAGSVGVLTGIYLAELVKPRRNGNAGGTILRLAVEVLSGLPSIVLGLVGYLTLVIGLGWGYSYLPAVLILSVMVVPYIAKGTETAIRQVPTAYREGAEALGMSTGYALRKVILKTAFPGITTGLLLGLAISCGETAPLLYTAQFSDRLPHGLIHTQGFPYLTYAVFKYFDQSNPTTVNLSYDAAMLLVILVGLLLLLARVVVARTQRHAESRS
jgi:phosphate transport system permease protein